MRILVTGVAGFIGMYVAQKLVGKGYEVFSTDNINNYYSVDLKYSRLLELGIRKEDIKYGKWISSKKFNNLKFIQIDLKSKEDSQLLFDNDLSDELSDDLGQKDRDHKDHKDHHESHKKDKKNKKYDLICHLAAQAGVRYSLENPDAYIDSNISGFLHILEGCRNHAVPHLVYASSSSVYGLNNKVPFSEDDWADFPISFYAASKRANELMAYTYHHLFGFSTIGLRFFTVYGPWGRPDMAPFLFTKSIIEDIPIKIFNHGNMLRDFTYIDDITEAVIRIIEKKLKENKEKEFSTFNIGNSSPVKLMDFISELEISIGKEAKKEFMPMQAGDVFQTYSNTSKLEEYINYKPQTELSEGIKKFVEWYKRYYSL